MIFDQLITKVASFGWTIPIYSLLVLLYMFICVYTQQVVQGDLLIGVHILSREMDIVTLKVVFAFYMCKWPMKR